MSTENQIPANQTAENNTPNELQKCTHCKVSRPIDQFVGKTGTPVKRCLKCRETDERQKKRPDLVEKRNQHQREVKRYVKYRENKRNQNEEEYLKHNAEIATKWRERNQEHLKEWKTQNFAARFGGIKQQAQEKGIPWKDDLTDETCYHMMTSPCHYCGFISKETLNGLNRMNSKGIYELSNTVSSCKMCTFIKGSLDPKTFIGRCLHISKKFGGSGVFNPELWRDLKCVSYGEYKKRAESKGLEFELTKERFQMYSLADCYYCGKSPSGTHLNGIDRKYNNIGYTIENCATCCGECNQMKISLNDTQFIEGCKNISNHNEENTIEYPDIEICESRIAKREKQEVVKERIIITKQQPNKERPQKPPAEPYIPKQRSYTKGSNMPEGCSINPEQIPNYCYYAPPSKNRGESFVCGKLHPKQKETGNKDWKTTTSKFVTIEEKFAQLIKYINAPNEITNSIIPSPNPSMERTPNEMTMTPLMSILPNPPSGRGFEE
jgi:hypothetical protein